jgi:hypothetical protein
MQRVFLFAAMMLLLSGSALARQVTVIMKSSEIVKGDMVGANDGALFLNEKGKAREITLADIKEIFDSKTNERVNVMPASTEAADAVSAAPAVTSGPVSEVQTGPAPSGLKETGEAPRKFGAEIAEVPSPPRAPAQTASQEPKSYLEIFGYGSLNNSYAIGKPLQQWMGDDIQSGSPAFANFGAAILGSLDPENTLFMGVGVSMNVPPSHSIWGSNLYFGGRNELVLDPYTFSLDVPFRYAFQDSGFSLTLTPSLLMTFLTGKYSTNGIVNIDGKPVTGTFYTNMGSMGLGFGLSASAEYYLGMFGLGAKLGFRMLESAINFDSVVGPWSPSDGKGNAINIDLGGSYMTIGVMLKFGN